MASPSSRTPAHLERIFPGDSQMARRMRLFDWSNHELGKPSRWPQNLRTAVGMCLNSPFPTILWWGANFDVFYNDAFIAFLSEDKHPHALGQPGWECWPETWDIVGPVLERVRTTGEGAAFEDLPFYFSRRLPREEVFVRFSHGPILAADGRTVDGIFTPCTETTQQVVGARRLEILRKLGIRAIEDGGVEGTCKDAAAVLKEDPQDIPFAAIYLVNAAREQAVLVASAGLADPELPLPRSVSLSAGDESPWHMRFVLRTHQPEEIDLTALGLRLLGGPWPEPAEKAQVLPMLDAGHQVVSGFLVVGVSTRQVLEASYRNFFNLLATHIGTAVADVRAHEAERLRAESLAEVDRAKTLFLSNVSHEFRTPLTLILGPLEDEIRGNPYRSDRLRVAHRNSLRLLKLVNALLDYSRAEAGRIDATYEPVDLAVLTAELASNFRAAIEKAGMELQVHCPPLPEPVYVDREMWEKIVLNLLSNAFKFTFQGSITVSQEVRDKQVELTVRDTGSGIPPEALPHIFERFYRVKSTRARSQDGTGIGLALVQQLTRLHGGSVRVESLPGQGSTFTVAIPLGSSHLPAERIVPARDFAESTSLVRPFVEEASGWLIDGAAESVDVQATQAASQSIHGGTEIRSRVRPTIVWAEDNDDMREYVQRLLQGTYEVKAVANGEEALSAVRRHRPDLVLSDIMMPRGDGFDLLREIRAAPETRAIPVVFLSARTSDEAHIEGREAGVDDYVDKPFAARELLARISSNVNLARVRRETEQRISALVESAMDAIISIDEDQRIVLFNRAAAVMFRCPASEAIGSPLERFIPERFRAAHRQHILRFAETGTTARAMGRELGVLWGLRADGEEFPIEASISQVELDWHRQLTVILRDISDRLRHEEQLVSLSRNLEAGQAEQSRLQAVLNNLTEGVVLFDLAGNILSMNPAAQALTGLTDVDQIRQPLHEFAEAFELRTLDGRVLPLEERPISRVQRGETFTDYELEVRRKDTVESLIIAYSGSPVRDARGKVAFLGLLTLRDVTDRTRWEQALKASEEDLKKFKFLNDNANDGHVLLDEAGRIRWVNRLTCERLGYSEAELLRMEVMDLFPSHTLAEIQELFERARQGRMAPFETAQRCKDGSIIPIETSVSVLEFKGEWLMFMSCRDITERKGHERALLESERRLALALAASNSGVWELDVATREVRGKDSLYAVVGYAPGELPTLDNWMALVHEDDRQGLSEAIRETIEGKREKYHFEGRLRARDGTVRWYLCQAMAADRNSDGQAIRLVGTYTDINERKVAEAEIQRLNAELERRIWERTAELERSNDALLRSNTELQHFAHATAHDLKTPLRSIAGFAQLMQRSAQASTDEELKEYSELVVANTHRLYSLIENLLAYTGLEAQGLPFEPVDLREVIDEVVQSLVLLIRETGAEVSIGQLPTLPVDRVQIAQVFQNLIENGIKYNQSKPPRVAITSELQDGEWVFSVADNGIGIDPRHHERIFEIFRRLHTYHQVPGSGIGLALCRRIVERHGGHIWVESRPGEGSTFYFTLPAGDVAENA